MQSMGEIALPYTMLQRLKSGETGETNGRVMIDMINVAFRRLGLRLGLRLELPLTPVPASVPVSTPVLVL